jgi:pimeloyl-ACP methyl ester carboxylesterase
MNQEQRKEQLVIDSAAQVNGVKIAYQLHGNADHPTLLLIHGLSTPLTGWPQLMINQFTDSGYRVLLLDNRDMGCSEKLDKLGVPNMALAIAKYKLGLSVPVAYRLDDMMQDVIALLDHLNIERVDVVGASMGGMIAQLAAIHHPDRVKTLTSIMSTTGYKNLPRSAKHISEYMLRKPASREYKDKLAFHIGKWRIIQSPAYPASEIYIKDYVDSMLQRGITAKGTMRQLLAIMAAKNRTKALSQLKVPALILHGDSDGLVNVEGGKETAKAIPNSKLKIYSGMGHDFPIELIPEICNDLVSHAREG